MIYKIKVGIRRRRRRCVLGMPGPREHCVGMTSGERSGAICIICGYITYTDDQCALFEMENRHTAENY